MNALTLHNSLPQAEFAAAAPVDFADHVPALQADAPAFGRTTTEELLNTATHGVGFVLALIGARSMANKLLGQADAWLLAGCGTYLVSLLGVSRMRGQETHARLAHDDRDIRSTTRPPDGTCSQLAGV